MWVFAYGSLMWRPDFRHAEIRPAVLRGYHRRLCVYSVTYRGTRERPGLVFGLDRGGSCRGRGLRVAAPDVDDVVAYLYEREMINRVYHPRMVGLDLAGGERVEALAFVADRSHEQYAGKIADAAAAALVLQGEGRGGHCIEYLRNTAEHLAELGIRDRHLERVLKLAEARLAGGA